jgi:hypothetical protein
LTPVTDRPISLPAKGLAAVRRRVSSEENKRLDELVKQGLIKVMSPGSEKENKDGNKDPS